MRENQFKARLASGDSVAGVIVSSPDEQLVEVLGLAGFDFVFIDCEHGTMSVGETESLVRAADLAGVSAVVRVPHNAEDLILRHLDTGAMTVVVPQVITADDVRRAVGAAYYHPRGSRGLAGTRAASYGLAEPLTEYTVRANQEIAVVALIENVQAIENLPEILQVEGLTAVHIGPADLSQSLGRPGDRHHPDVEGAIAQIIEKAREAGVPVGINTSTGEDALTARDRGCQITTVSSWGLLAGAARDYLSVL
ncbi:MAG: HpcH/HpaI aldolase family protein [Chloroflexota bacterium]